MTGLALSFQLTFNDHLGGDSGVITARLPQRVMATHAIETDQGIHDGVVEAMAHVEAPRDIRGRYHDAVGTVSLVGWSEPPVFLPGFVPALLDAVWIVGLVHG